MSRTLCWLLITSAFLSVAAVEPSPEPELRRLQGVWNSEDGTTLRIDGDRIHVQDPGGLSFAAEVVVRPRLRVLRLVAGRKTLLQPYRLDGDLLTLELEGIRTEYLRKR